MKHIQPQEVHPAQMVNANILRLLYKRKWVSTSDTLNCKLRPIVQIQFKVVLLCGVKTYAYYPSWVGLSQCTGLSL